MYPARRNVSLLRQRGPCRQVNILWQYRIILYPIQWRHNGGDSVSNHQPQITRLNRLFRRRSRKTSKLRVTGLREGNSPVAGEFPAQMASNAENASIWWHNHAISIDTFPTLAARIARGYGTVHLCLVSLINPWYGRFTLRSWCMVVMIIISVGLFNAIYDQKCYR